MGYVTAESPSQNPETALPHEYDQGIAPARTKREQRLNKWTVHSPPAVPCKTTPRDLWGHRDPIFGCAAFRRVCAYTDSHQPRKRKPKRNFRNVDEAQMQRMIRECDEQGGCRPEARKVRMTLGTSEEGEKVKVKEEKRKGSVESSAEKKRKAAVEEPLTQRHKLVFTDKMKAKSEAGKTKVSASKASAVSNAAPDSAMPTGNEELREAAPAEEMDLS
jgi:hypothetical protein